MSFVITTIVNKEEYEQVTNAISELREYILSGEKENVRELAGVVNSTLENTLGRDMVKLSEVDFNKSGKYNHPEWIKEQLGLDDDGMRDGIIKSRKELYSCIEEIIKYGINLAEFPNLAGFVSLHEDLSSIFGVASNHGKDLHQETLEYLKELASARDLKEDNTGKTILNLAESGNRTGIEFLRDEIFGYGSLGRISKIGLSDTGRVKRIALAELRKGYEGCERVAETLMYRDSFRKEVSEDFVNEWFSFVAGKKNPEFRDFQNLGYLLKTGTLTEEKLRNVMKNFSHNSLVLHELLMNYGDFAKTLSSTEIESFKKRSLEDLENYIQNDSSGGSFFGLNCEEILVHAVIKAFPEEVPGEFMEELLKIEDERKSLWLTGARDVIGYALGRVPVSSVTDKQMERLLDMAESDLKAIDFLSERNMFTFVPLLTTLLENYSDRIPDEKIELFALNQGIGKDMDSYRGIVEALLRNNGVKSEEFFEKINDRAMKELNLFEKYWDQDVFTISLALAEHHPDKIRADVLEKMKGPFWKRRLESKQV